MGILGGVVFGGAVIAGTQFYKSFRSRLAIFIIAWLSLQIPGLDRLFFPAANASYSQVSWPWIGFLCGLFLVASAFTGRRRVRGQ